MTEKKRVFVFGIDGAPPELIFDKWLDELPNIKKLVEEGFHSKIETTIPPSTCVAWTSFFSGLDPSQHGVYSYTVRDNFEYKGSRLVNSRDVKGEMLWEILSKYNKKTISIGVPLTYPIENKTSPNFSIVSGFLTPTFNEKSVYPKEFFEEVKNLIPNYSFDVNVGLASYKQTGKEELIEKCYKMTKQNIDLIKHCIKNKEWDLLIGVLVASDRLEHSFWSYIDKTHRYYKGETQYKNLLKDYFIYLDREIGEIVKLLPKNTTIIISSDHGMDKMNCRFNLNDWLIKEGYLVLKEAPPLPQKLKMEDVDWSRTRAFSVGAYFGRIYLNLKGREPQGVVNKEERGELQKEIAGKLKQIKDDKGNEMDNKIFFPENIYSGEFINQAPDLMIYFDNLHCGVNNDVGNTEDYSWATTKGSDDAGHAPLGTFIFYNNKLKGQKEKINICDVAPTILSELNLPIPEKLNGKKLQEKDKAKIIVTVGPTTNSEEMIKKIKETGIDFIRVNMSHSSLGELERVIKLSKDVGVPFILDTEGSQIRTGDLNKNVIVLEEGQEIRIHKDKITGDEENICLKPGKILQQLQVSDLINLDFDGLLLKVSDISTRDQGFIKAKVVTGGILGQNKSAVIEQVIDSTLRLPALSEKDLKAIEIGLKHNVKFIAASFIRNKEDIEEVRRAVQGKMKIISKIETKESMKNLDEIIQESDFCLIDRGDLSKEISPDRIPLTQKIILKRAKAFNTPTFIATNLLESMIERSKPTRAELNDIMNSLIDGASGLILCAETAIGKYPLECINTLKRMIQQSEIAIDTESEDNSTDSVVERLEKLNYIEEGISNGLLIEPHGGKLVDRILKEVPDEDYLNNLLRLEVDEEKEMDIEQIAIGTFSPIEGFMNKEELISVLDNMRLPDNTVWTIPLLFDVDKETAEKINIGQTIFLKGKNNLKALFNVESKYSFDKEELSEKWFGTKDPKHPGVKMVQEMKPIFLGGKINLIKRKESEFAEHELTPAQTRRIFEERNWSKIVGFHTRNVIHRSHEYLQLDAMEKNSCQGLFVHPVIGKKKKGDFQTKFIIESYEKMMQEFYPKGKTVFGAFSTFSRYAGPREAVFTAICRKNFGCSHFIVGRDHTGVGNFYHPHASHKIFDQFPDLGIKAVKYDKVFYSEIYNKHIHEPEMPDHPEDKKLHISGTQAREILKRGENPPEWFLRPEIANIILKAIKNNQEVFVGDLTKKAKTIWFTGLSGSGKTTLALDLKRKLEQKGKKVEIIDGDIIRNTLHKHLGFSREDIRLNNKLIAELCKEKENQIDFILVPIISPYKEDRLNAKQIINPDNFIELHINTSLDECIRRDVKGLYKKAKQGEINNLIGFSDSNPYETPEEPNLRIDTTNKQINENSEEILNFLEEKNPKIDLHTHTTASDGDLTPAQIIDQAIQENLSTIAITDHDTTAGLKEAIDYSKDKPIEIIPGIEIGTDEIEKNILEIHILGLFIDPDNPELLELTRELKQKRITQKKKIIEKLNELGYEITFEELQQEAEESFGRPHIAKILIKKYSEQFSTITEVFNKLLGKGKPAFVLQEKPSMKKAIDTIKQAGGIAVLAHPGVYTEEIGEILEIFFQAGGQGIEVYYPYNKINQVSKEEESNLIERFKKITQEKNMLITGGSDFHGESRPPRLGDQGINNQELEKLKNEKQIQ